MLSPTEIYSQLVKLILADENYWLFRFGQYPLISEIGYDVTGSKGFGRNPNSRPIIERFGFFGLYLASDLELQRAVYINREGWLLICDYDMPAESHYRCYKCKQVSAVTWDEYDFDFLGEAVVEILHACSCSGDKGEPIIQQLREFRVDIETMAKFCRVK